MNTPVLAELGRFPMKLSIDIQMVKYFLRLDKLPNGRFLRKLYIENKSQQKNRKGWNYHINEILNKCGLSYIWRNQFNNIKQDKKGDFINRLIFTRMKDISSQNALAHNKQRQKQKLCKNEFFITNKANLHLQTII